MQSGPVRLLRGSCRTAPGFSATHHLGFWLAQTGLEFQMSNRLADFHIISVYLFWFITLCWPSVDAFVKNVHRVIHGSNGCTCTGTDVYAIHIAFANVEIL